MKQIFRFASVFALAGAALLYTGCAKDYNEEIASVKQELKNLQDGVIADHTSQIKTLQSQVTTLQSVDQTLAASISAVDAAYKEADKKLSDAVAANASEIKALEKECASMHAKLQEAINSGSTEIALLKAKYDQLQSAMEERKAEIKELQTKLQEQKDALAAAKAALAADIKQNANSIEKLQTALSEHKTYAEQTYATKAALEEVSRNLGSLSASVEAIDARLTAADVKLAADIASVKTTADKAASDVAYALGQITELWNNFNNYYKKGEVDAMISDVNAEIALLKAKDKEIADKLAEEVSRLDGVDAANAKAISEEIANREAEVEALAKKLAEEVLRLDGVDAANYKALSEAIAALAAHVSSEVARLDGVDSELAKDIAANAKDIADEIAKRAEEVARLDKADDALSAAIAELAQKLNKEVARLDGVDSELAKNIKANTDAITAEISTRATEISRLESDIAANATAIAANAKAIAQEVLDREAADKTLNDLLTSEVARLEGLIKANSDAISENVKAIAKNASDIAAEITAREEAIKGLRTELMAEIEKVKKELESQIATEVGKINTTIEGILSRLSTAEGSIAQNAADIAKNVKDIAANAQAILDEAKARESADTELENALNTAVKQINEQISALNATVAQLKNVDEGLQNQINEITGSATALTARVSKLEGDLSAEMTARAEADEAILKQLGEVKKQLEEKDAELAETIKTLSEKTDQSIAALQDKDAELAKTISEETAKLQEQIDALVGGDIKELKADVEKIKEDIKTINSNIAAINENVSDIAGRVTSISVCPSKEDEVITIKVGDKNVRMFKATFEVEPVAAAAAFTKENIVLTYAEARPRTKGALTEGVSYKEAVIDSVYADAAGRVTVIAKNIDPLESNNNARFFALTYNGVDKASKYSVTSDYAQALESDSAYDLIAYFKYSVRGVVSIAKTLLVPTRVDYVTAAKDETVYEPFKDFAIVYNCEKLKNFIPEQLTPEKFTEWTGLELTFVPEYSIDYPLIDVDLKELNSKDRFDNTVDLSQYVRFESYYFLLQYTINNEKWNRDLKHQVTLTKVQHNIVDLDNLYLYWNYKTYKDADRIASKKVSEMAESIKNVWDEAANHGAKAVKQLGFNGKAGVVFDFGVWDQTENDYLDEIKATGRALPDTAFTGNYAYKDTINKTCTSDDYFFAVKVSGDAKMADQVLVVNAEVPGSVTKQVNVPVANVFSSILKDENGNVKPALISGLTGDDAKYDNVYNAAKRCIVSKHFNITVDGESIGDSYTFKPETDSLYIHVPAGKMLYGKTHTIVATADDIFGFKYTITVTATSSTTNMALEKKPMYIDPVTNKANVRGIFKSNLYTIDEMFQNHYLKMTDDSDLSNEAADALYRVEFTVVEDTVKTNWGSPTGHGLPDFEYTVPCEKTMNYIDKDTKEFIYNGNKFIWNGYKGRLFTVKAQLCVLSQDKSIKFEVGTPVEFQVEAEKPLKFEGNTPISVTRTAGKDESFNLWKGLSLKGLYDDKGAKWTGNLIDQYTGAVSTTQKYPGLDKVYYTVGESITATSLDGQRSYTLKQGSDYSFDSAATEFTYMKESAIGESITFKIPVYVNNQFDYCGKEKVTSEVVVIVNVNK